jgi:hypothetical protein
MTSEAEQRKMFGITMAEVVAEKPKFEDPGMWAMSILSDVQEIISRRYDPTSLERARQWINKAKYWIDAQRHFPTE